MVRYGQGGLRGAPRRVCGTLEGRGAPALCHFVLPEGVLRAHGCRWWDKWCRTMLVRAKACRSAGINKVSVRGPAPPDDTHRCATGGPAGRTRGQGGARGRLSLAGVGLHDQEADGSKREGTAGLEQAAVADLHQAIGQDM